MKIVQAPSRKLSLSTTDEGGHLRLAWLGVGSAFATLNGQTNVLLLKGDTAILVDCGTKAIHSLADLGVSLFDIDTYLPTHSHADHVGGLEEVALKNRYVAPFVKGGQKGDYKPRCIVTEEYQSYLWNFSLRGGLAFSEQMKTDGTAREMRFTDYFAPLRPKSVEGYDRPVYRVDHEGINLLMMRTKHIPEEVQDWADCFWSCGLVIDGRVLYPGDTRFDGPLIDQFVTDDIEAIFHDCQSFNGGVHAGLSELKALPAEVKSRMWLVHLDDNMLQLDSGAGEAVKAATGALAELRGTTTDRRALAEAQLTIDDARATALQAADEAVRADGFAGLARSADEVYYDLV